MLKLERKHSEYLKTMMLTLAETTVRRPDVIRRRVDDQTRICSYEELQEYFAVVRQQTDRAARDACDTFSLIVLNLFKQLPEPFPVAEATALAGMYTAVFVVWRHSPE